MYCSYLFLYFNLTLTASRFRSTAHTLMLFLSTPAIPLLQRHLTSLVSHLLPQCLSKLLPPSSQPPHPRPIGHGARFLPGPRVYFLFVLAQGAMCPERPTAWSLPAVSTWHSLACRGRVTPPETKCGHLHTRYVHRRVYS